jgi:PAS domain S-box-containing protein
MKKANKETRPSSNASQELRAMAEDRLQHLQTAPLDGMSEADVAALVHELRVHRIELEMQNESLRQAQVDLEQSRAKYTDLFDFAPVGYLVFDREGVVLETNLTAAGMLQIERRGLAGAVFSTFVQSASRDTWAFHYGAVFKTGRLQECEIELRRKDKSPLVARLRSRPVMNEQGEAVQCRTTMTDVTALVRAERRLKISERRFRTLAENSPDVIVRIERDMLVTYANGPAEKAFGIAPTELVGLTLEESGVPREMVEAWNREVGAVFETARTRHAEFSTSQARAVRHYSAIFVPEIDESRKISSVLATVRDITERVRAEERYGTILRNSQEGFAILDDRLRHIDANNAYCRMIGCTCEQLHHLSVLDVVTPECREEIARRRQEVDAQGYTHFEAQHEHEDGSRIDLNISVQRMNDGQFSAFMRDITEQRRAERQRSESLQRLELAAEATQDGIWDWDLATDTVWRGDALATMLGYAPDEPDNVPEWWRDRIHPQERDMVLASVEKLLHDGEDQWSIRYRFRRKDGSYAWIMDRGRVLRDEQGKAVRVVGAMTDLTEKLELVDQLESERTKLTAILETAQSGIIVVDAQGRPTYANPVLQEIHQRSLATGSGVESHMQMGVLHLDGTPYDVPDLPLVRAATQGEATSNVELLIERPNGQRRHILTNASPLRDSRGNILGAVAVVHDITELKEAEQALVRARDELEARVRKRTAELDETVSTLQEEVAEKVEAQDRLMHQNDVLQKIIGNIPAMLCFYDAQGNVAMVNREFERVLGYTMENIEQSSLLELCYPDPAYRQEVWQHMSSGEPGWKDFLVQRRRGGKVLSSWANIRLADGSYVGIGIDIRERKRFENHLRDSEERYRTLVELSPDAICVEREGTIVFANSTALRLLGARKIGDLIGKSLLDFVHPEDREQTREQHATVAAKHAPVRSVEKRIVRLDGQPLDVEASAMPITFESKPAIQIVLHDITERKRAEERLRRSAWQLQQQAELLDLAHDTIVVHDMDGRITFWNRGAEQTYGWSREEAVGKVSHELLRTAFPHNLMEITAKLLAHGRWDGELVHTTRDGRRIIVSSRWALQRDEEARPAAILVIDRDITQQKKAEEAMNEARRFAESVIDTVQEALLVLDPDLRVISANHTFYDTFQVHPEETQGQFLYDIGNCQWDIPDLRRLLEGILPHDSSFENFEVEHDFERIGRRTMILNARRIYREKQETEMILLAMMDITIRKQQEQEIRDHQRQLASLTEQLLFAEERERRRLAVALHDSIGQSLAFSKRELGVLQKHVPAAAAEAIEGVKNEIDEAIHQTRDLTFELSPATLHTFGLEAGIEELCDQFRRQEEFAVRFEATDEDKPLTDQVKVLLYRATRELLLNVVKHAEAKNVSVRVDRVDNQIRIRVADDGRGFDLSAIGEVAGERRGFGIFSIRERLTHVGGSFQIVSEPGKGTEATLIAPLRSGPLQDGDQAD